MYQVRFQVPLYDNYDRCVGSTSHPVEGLPAYETQGMAFAKRDALAWQNDEHSGDISFCVIDLNTRSRVVRALPAAWHDDQDIPF